MKKFLVRTVSLALCLVVAISCFSFWTSAATVTYKSAANGVSSSYKSSRFYKNLTQIELTGDGATDVLAVALSQVGYLEGVNENGFGGTQGGGGNYTEYTYNMGKVGSYSYAWCAAFVSWSLLQSGCTTQNTQGAWCRNHMGDKNYIWREVGCYRWYNQLKNFGYGRAADGKYTPKSGDLIFFESSEHIGIVRYAKNGTVYTIEGNTSKSGFNSEGGGVFCKEYKITGGAIRGFGTLPYKVNTKVNKIDYSGENPTPGLWIGETNKYLYPDSKMSGSNYTVIEKGNIFEVVEIVTKSCFKVKFNGKTGYVNVNSDKIYQVTSSAPAEPPVEKNTYYISKDMKKISGHFGSGIDKYYVDNKGTSKVKDVYDLTAGQQVGIQGFAGFDSFAKEYGYYFDGNAESAVWNSKPIDADAETTKKGGTKTTEFKILAPTDTLSNGEHTVTFAVKLLNKKEHPLITLKLNITGAGAVPPATQAPATSEPSVDTAPPISDVETEAPIIDQTEETFDNGGCADDTGVGTATGTLPSTEIPSTNIPGVVGTDTGIGTGTGAVNGQPTTAEIGCGASVAVATLAPIILAAGVVMMKKKKED